MFIDLDRVKKRARYPAISTEQVWSIKGFIIQLCFVEYKYRAKGVQISHDICTRLIPPGRVKFKTLASQNFGKKKSLDNKSLIRRFGVQYRCIFLLVVCILTRPTGSSKYRTTRKNIQRYYTPKRLIRYIYYMGYASASGNFLQNTV